MNKKIKNTIWILILLMLILTACSSQNPEELLKDKTWNLISMGIETEAKQILPGSQVTIEFRFEDNQIGGLASCNNYFAGFEINGNELNISAAGSTMMYCEPEELMAQEFEFLSALGETHHFSINNEQLVIEYGEGKVLIFQ